MRYWAFDLDGTLVDSLTVHFQVMEKVFLTYGLHFDETTQQEILKLSANTLPVYFERTFGINSQAALQLFRNLTTASIQSIQPFQQIRELLDLLKSRQVGLAIWTARELDASIEILRSAGLQEYFSLCVSGTCVARGKPDPEGLEKISRHFNCSPHELVVVGDFDSDMLGAQAFGAMGVRADWHSSVEKKECRISHKRFKRVDDFIDWLKENGFSQGQS